MLPLVRQIVRDLVDVHESVELQRAQMEGIGGIQQPVGLPPYADEVQAVQLALQADQQRLVACREELQALGVQVHSARIGVVDFPAYLHRQPVLLCWQLGEAAVRHWHAMDSPVEGRRPIADEPFQTDEAGDPLALPRDGTPPIARPS